MFSWIFDTTGLTSKQGKLLKKTYNRFAEFVHDVARICHNAQVYNRPSAPVFSEAVRLREVFKEKLHELVKAGTIQADEAVLPDFGDLPPVEDTPPPGEDDELEEAPLPSQPRQQYLEDDEDEDEEDEIEEESDDSRKPRKRRRTRKDDVDDDYVKKRGRPPKVLTPAEARINALLRGIRKPRGKNGQLRILQFEKLPDKVAHKDYYDRIRNPIALDQIKRNTKRKKYRNVDECLADLNLMFENAKHYNEDDSAIYEDAVELKKEAALLADQEKAKPDELFRDEDGKLPLSEVQHKGETFKVGELIHHVFQTVLVVY